MTTARQHDTRADRHRLLPAATAGYSRVGEYTVTATTTWSVHPVGGSQQGDLTTTSTSHTSVRIGELQVVGQ
ncbi:hypothetical protein ACFYYB_26160 [Streptomyces sp. NPDC002886]|uniref:hypothetical protein n=1 Tax=Streptomyces sp. NPDC002886 TaxID=3364667 RepID=UPI0036A9CCAE